METKNRDDVLPKLSKISLFSDFDPNKEADRAILTQLYEIISMKRFKPGQVIIQEGDIGDEIFYVHGTFACHH